MINLLHEQTKAQTRMLHGTRSTQTHRQKKFLRYGQSKTSSKQAKSKEGIGLMGMTIPPENSLHDQGSPLASETMNLVHDYTPKIPQVSRPFREYNSPERVPRFTRTPQERSYASSLRRESSDRNFNLSTLVTSDLPKRPVSSLSPLRYLFLLHVMFILSKCET